MSKIAIIITIYLGTLGAGLLITKMYRRMQKRVQNIWVKNLCWVAWSSVSFSLIISMGIGLKFFFGKGSNAPFCWGFLWLVIWLGYIILLWTKEMNIKSFEDVKRRSQEDAKDWPFKRSN